MKKKKVNEWKKTSIKHALWRAKDRGINIGKGELDEIVHNILYEGLEPVREESIHRKVYKAKDRDGEVYFFVFDSRMNCVVTVFKETKYNFSKKSDSIRTKAEEMVIKMIACRPYGINKWQPTVKLSDVSEKHTGKGTEIELCKRTLNINDL